MCTAISYRQSDHYFGRNLDMVKGYREEITITPKNYVFRFRNGQNIFHHYAMIGMATVVSDYPLYYEATNEWGLSMAGLLFAGNACYFPEKDGADNIAPFEFIPWILAQCKDVKEARSLLAKINLWDTHFNDSFPNTPLHWLIGDKEGAVTVESVRDGLRIYENPIGVLTNNPTFDYHMTHLCDYSNLTPYTPEGGFGEGVLTTYSRGMGAMGLPGDVSSASRFVRAAFVKLNSVSGESEEESISQFFHILGAVEQQRGCCRTEDGGYETTIYTSCCNTDRGIYYYNTYGNHQITAVHLYRENLDGCALVRYPTVQGERMYLQN